VNGYTDDAPVGTALQREGVTSNQIPSQKRAENVMEFLISRGLNPSLFEAHGFGDANPVASNKPQRGEPKTGEWN
jgi:chemotaxis protein MotB